MLLFFFCLEPRSDKSFPQCPLRQASFQFSHCRCCFWESCLWAEVSVVLSLPSGSRACLLATVVPAEDGRHEGPSCALTRCADSKGLGPLNESVLLASDLGQHSSVSYHPSNTFQVTSKHQFPQNVGAPVGTYLWLKMEHLREMLHSNSLTAFTNSERNLFEHKHS